MEYMPKYKLMPKPKEQLFKVPNYCRVVDKTFRDTPVEEQFEAHLNLEVTNPAKILYLCESLIDVTTKDLEKKVNRYLRIESVSTKVFLINICQASDEAMVQVVNETSLKKPFRVDLTEDFFDNIVVIEGDNLICQGKLDVNITSLIEDVLGHDGGEVLSVPVMSKGRKNFFDSVHASDYGNNDFNIFQQNDDYVINCVYFPRDVVETKLKQLDASKGARPDWKGGRIPTILKTVIHNPIHKSGPRVLIKNYRGVTIISILPKVMEAIVASKGRDFYCPVRDIYPAYIACFVNTPRSESYIIRLVTECFRFCLTIMMNTIQSEEEARLKRQSQSLLYVARKLFSRLVDINVLLKEIMLEARRLTNAERCSLFLLDPDTKQLVAKVFDGASPLAAQSEVKIRQDQGIAGHVAATGNLLNIKNAYEHPLFFKGMDEATGFKTRNMLCFPIRDEEGVVGVAQLCNKKSGGNFDYFDEEVANAFGIYCGLSIVHSLMYKKINDAQARSKLSNELMMYHMKISTADVADMLLCPGNHQHPDLDKFYFSPRNIILKETPCFVLKMIDELKFIEGFRVKKETLGRFILFVQRGYRDTPYHNWWHAFSVAHFAYLCIKNFELEERGYLTKLECFSYIIACLCHDIDHRGTTNAFQQQVGNTLASLYSSEGSVMERHHLSQTLCILNTEDCNFLEELSSTEYRKCLDYIKDMILATDLATHFKLYRRQLLMVQEGYKRNKNEHRYVFVCLLMTCADLSDQTKNWSVVKKVAQHVYEEFFMQGDMEKQMGRVPVHMMDREKASIPDLQIEFLKNVCLPVFQLLVLMFPNAKIMVDNIKRNMLCWETSKKIFEKFSLEGKISLEALTSMSLEAEVLQIVDEVLRA